MKLLTCAKTPCKSCPYRKDVPSGIWAAKEYNKLPCYDGDIGDQWPKQEAWARFDCHQQNGKLCAGWVGCHGAHNLLALRILASLGKLDPSVLDYKSPVPLFASGQEARDHGKRAIRRPSTQARQMVGRLQRLQTRIKRKEK